MTTSPITCSRSLHLVDLENLVGDPRADAEVALDTFHEYLDAARWDASDHLIVARNPWLMTKIAFDLPTACSRHAAHGRDGADTMLLSLAPPELVVKRYGVSSWGVATASSSAGPRSCTSTASRSMSWHGPTDARPASTGSGAPSSRPAPPMSCSQPDGCRSSGRGPGAAPIQACRVHHPWYTGSHAPSAPGQ
jgi:hypothetical protein